MSAERPILVLTAAAGAGHTTAAAAVAAALRAAAPGAEVELLDVLDRTNPVFRAIYAGGYAGLVRCWPGGMGLLYDAVDRPLPPFDMFRAWFQDLNAEPLLRYLQERRPRLVVNTHFLPAELVARARQRRELHCPQATICTDFETHRLWIQPPTERYYTATEIGRAYLAALGVAAGDVRVTGLPIRPEFRARIDAAAFRRAQGLAADVPLVVLVCGAAGLKRIAELLDPLARMESPAQIVVIAGRNAALRADLEERAAAIAAQRAGPASTAGRGAVEGVAGAPLIRILGFSNEMHFWLQAADVLVTKPGGLTTAEALACGVPMVLVNPIPGQEARNADYLLECGAAIRVNRPQLVGLRVAELLRDPARRAALRAAALRAARPDAAEQIARDALGLCDPRTET
jgi:processive 1,2-diacylglycerol beta-glucosyltransferase